MKLIHTKFIGKLLGTLALVALAGPSWAIPFTTGFSLTDSTDNVLCPAGCYGTITLDVPSIPLSTVADGTVVAVLDVDIAILPSTLVFNSGSGLATISGGKVSALNFSLSSVDNHFLLAAGQDWTVGGPIFSGGGSGFSVPEPTSIALLGIGLLGLGAARFKKGRTGS